MVTKYNLKNIPVNGLMEQLDLDQYIRLRLRDGLIRLFDLCAGMKIDVASIILEKLEFNVNRPDHKRENHLKGNGKKY